MMPKLSPVRQAYFRLAARADEEDTVLAARHWLAKRCNQETPWASTAEGTGSGPEVLPLLPGCWLQSVLHAGNAEKPLVLALFQIYRHCQAEHAPVNFYRKSLVAEGLVPAPLDSLAFARDLHWAETAYERAAIALALGLNASAFLAEVSGFTIAWVEQIDRAVIPSDPPEKHAWVDAVRTLILRLKDAVQAEASVQHDWAMREAEGRALAALCLNGSPWACGPLKPFGATPADQLIESRALHARGYHQQVMLGGRKLDDWFQDEPFANEAFRQALRDSPWLRETGSAGEGTCPLDRLIAFGGPMFGIFSSEEINQVKAWAKATEPSVKSQALHALKSDVAEALCGFETKSLTPSGPITWRSSYYRLLNPERGEGLDAVAHRVARRFFLLTPFMRFSQRYRAFSYHPDALYDHVHERHRYEVSRYHKRSGKPALSKAVCLMGIQQMAPSILLDGCWLQGLQKVCWQEQPAVSRLMRIFDDELGAGVRAQHHPLIYRELLASAGLHYPEVSADAFANHHDFSTAAFILPVFLLSVARGGRRYFPEVLGLNLAIELGGLGAQYMGLVDTLRYWGFDPLIVQLHLSIDNLASGHAAMAVEAIILYLDEVRRSQGPTAVDTEWRRVWAGYRSLAVASIPIATRLVVGAIFSGQQPQQVSSLE